MDTYSGNAYTYPGNAYTYPGNAYAFPGEEGLMAEASMRPQVNIVAVVDVMGALSQGSLGDGNLCLVDDGGYGSTGQGTAQLCTVCLPGQLVTWTAVAVDVQTPVEIRAITVLGPDGAVAATTAAAGNSDPGEHEGLARNEWSGVVPPSLAGQGPWRYRLELQMYEGESSVLGVESPALTCVLPRTV